MRCPDVWLVMSSGCVCQGVSGRDENLKYWVEKKALPFPMWAGTTRSVVDLDKTKGKGREDLFSSWLPA